MTQRRLTARRGVSVFLIGLLVLSAGAVYWFWKQSEVPPDVLSPTPTAIRVAPKIEPAVLNPGLQPAFPGAEGAGAANRGGRGGQVIEVTSLNDSGPGSLRAALTTPGPRIVVFRVGGVIELERSLVISEPYIMVAGQTAPGGGITLSGTNNIDGEMLILRDVHDVILRYLRIRNNRLGEPGQGQINIAIDSGSENILIDHVSVSWALDENLMIHRNIPEGESHEDWPGISKITIQRSLIAEGLHPHSTGIEIGGENEVDGWRGVQDITIHHNLFVHNNLRNPGVGSLHTQIINNVVYNWGGRVGSTWRNVDVDWIANFFKRGPMSHPEHILVHVDYPKNEPHNRWPAPSLFAAGNLAPPQVSAPWDDNWALYQIHYANTPLPEEFRRQEPLPFTAVPVQIDTAEEAYLSVVADAGANARLSCDGAWVPNSDAVDQRLIADVHQGSGPQKRPIESASEVGGLPAIDPGTSCPDADHDGMPDAWEVAHPPLDPGTNDASGTDLHSVYTNLEVYLNGLQEDDLMTEVLNHAD